MHSNQIMTDSTSGKTVDKIPSPLLSEKLKEFYDLGGVEIKPNFTANEPIYRGVSFEACKLFVMPVLCGTLHLHSLNDRPNGRRQRLLRFF